jgi:prefoldin subunit 5
MADLEQLTAQLQELNLKYAVLEAQVKDALKSIDGKLESIMSGDAGVFIRHEQRLCYIEKRVESIEKEINDCMHSVQVIDSDIKDVVIDNTRLNKMINALWAVVVVVSTALIGSVIKHILG